MASRSNTHGNTPRAALAPEAARAKRGRRPTARSKLIAAAYTVMSRRGLEGSTQTEIIEEAGVGVGSFYNNFGSKEELAQAVFASKAEEFGASLEETVRHIPDPALATCYAYRRLIEETELDQVWAAFIVQLEPSLQMLDKLLRRHARVGIRLGLKQGVFSVTDPEMAITAVHAIEIAVVRDMLRGAITHKAAHQSSHLALRLLGVPEDVAQRLSHLSMAALKREVRATRVAEDRAASQP